MTDRVRSSPLGRRLSGSKISTPSLIAYARPDSYVDAPSSSPLTSPSQSTQPASRNVAAPSNAPPSHAGYDEDDDLPYGDESQPHSHISSHARDDTDLDSALHAGSLTPQSSPPSPSAIIGGSGHLKSSQTTHASLAHSDSSVDPSTLSLEPSKADILFQEFADGSERVMHALRGREDDAALVEDHILETMDFDKDEDYVHEDFMEKRAPIHRHFTMLLQFLLTLLVAFITAMLMFVVSHGVEAMFAYKVDVVLEMVEGGNGAGAYFAFLFLSLLFVLIACALVAVIAPNARGGGVPYVLAYLNGTNVMEYFSWRIVMIKSVSLIFTIAGGLTLGMEGPFVFIGGGVAAIVSSALDVLFPHSSYSKIIRGIREERIFMAGGMAAGLAVAFDAPIAGVLFALEGATAFLSAPVVLRIFGCAMFASFFNDIGHTNFSNYIKNHNLLEVSNSGTPSEYAWTILEIFPFAFIGIVGGVVGALATKINMACSRWRHHHMQGTSGKDVFKQLLEMSVFCFVTITCWFLLPYVYGCRPRHDLCDVVVSALPVRCQQAHCGEGMYSEAATIVYSTSNQIAALLFDRSLGWAEEFHVAPLMSYGIIYFLLVSSIYGAYVPGGLFVPSIVAGGMYGRVIGIACKTMFPLSSINPGVYSLLGAASMLGGFTRLALPVVIMLVELTGDATYLLPMMFCSVVGKFTSDALEPPLYPQHMALEHIPSLTDKLNPIIARMTAKEIMVPASKCQTMCTIERLSHVKTLLSKSRRIIFPLTTPTGKMAGLILRRNVMFCVAHYDTYATFEEAASAASRSHTDALRFAENGSGDWRKDKYDAAATITRGIDEIEDCYINMTPLMDAGCMTARPQTPAKRLAAMFRRVGLSHLCITDKNNIFEGMITRRSLITPPSTGSSPTLSHGAADASSSSSSHAVSHDVASTPLPSGYQHDEQKEVDVSIHHMQHAIDSSSSSTPVPTSSSSFYSPSLSLPSASTSSPSVSHTPPASPSPSPPSPSHNPRNRRASAFLRAGQQSVSAIAEETNEIDDTNRSATNNRL